MNEIFQVQREQLVLPRWLPFWKAVSERGFVRDGEGPIPVAASRLLREEMESFRAVPAPHVGAELMGLSFTLGHVSEARELAEYVRASEELSSVVRADANAILEGRNFELPGGVTGVRLAKQRLGQFPRDALTWLELGRLYTIKAQNRKAERAVTIALNLAPVDRHIVRAAIRFFIHTGEWAKALDIANRSYRESRDPMILGPLISVGTHLQEFPVRVKSVGEQALAAADVFSYSEALEAFGTLAAKESGPKPARRFFRQAWVDPTVPVIGHSQWVLRDVLPGMASDQKIDFNQSLKAVSWISFFALQFQTTIQHCSHWELEEPYSSEPYSLGSSAACLVGDYNEAEKIAQRGIKTNPNDLIIRNNLTFAQAKLGHCEAAVASFAPLKARLSSLTSGQEVPPTATYGCLLMARGDVQEGAAEYERALALVPSGNRELALGVRLNYLLSAFDVTKSLNPRILSVAAEQMKTTKQPGAFAVADLLVARIEKSDLQGSDGLSKAAQDFIATAAAEKKRYLDDWSTQGGGGIGQTR